jgi:hypothetical protein
VPLEICPPLPQKVAQWRWRAFKMGNFLRTRLNEGNSQKSDRPASKNVRGSADRLYGLRFLKRPLVRVRVRESPNHLTSWRPLAVIVVVVIDVVLIEFIKSNQLVCSISPEFFYSSQN